MNIFSPVRFQTRENYEHHTHTLKEAQNVQRLKRCRDNNKDDNTNWEVT